MSTNRSKDRSSLCSFTFADGRHCRTLECGGLVYPVYPDHRGEPRRAGAFEAKAPAIPTSARSTSVGCSGGSSDPPARRPRAPRVIPRAAKDLLLPLYLGQTLVQILPLAQDEYINAYNTDIWRETIRESHEQSANYTSPDPPSPDPEPAPAPTPAATSDASPASE